MELVLGAYTAGMVIAMLVRDTRAEILQNRLMSIGLGFFYSGVFYNQAASNSIFQVSSQVREALPASSSSCAAFSSSASFRCACTRACCPKTTCCR